MNAATTEPTTHFLQISDHANDGRIRVGGRWWRYRSCRTSSGTFIHTTSNNPRDYAGTTWCVQLEFKKSIWGFKAKFDIHERGMSTLWTRTFDVCQVRAKQSCGTTCGMNVQIMNDKLWYESNKRVWALARNESSVFIHTVWLSLFCYVQSNLV